MRVLIATQVFPPETQATAVMVKELADYLAGRGNVVSVAAGHPHHPHGRLPHGWKRRLLSRQTYDRVTVIRGWHLVSDRKSIAARAAVMISQALGVAGAALTADGADVLITFGLPLVGPLLSAVVATRFRAKIVTVVFDIYPDVAIETGKLTNRAIIAGMRVAESATYRVSDHLVVLSEGFRSTLIMRGVPPDKVSVIPVWLDDHEIQPEPRRPEWREQHGISADEWVVLYAGTIGLVSGARVILEAARILKAREPKVTLVLVGEGNVKTELEQAADGMTNLRFLPFGPRRRVGEMMASADVCLVTLAAGRGRASVPSKVVAYLAAGKAIIASVDLASDTANTVAQSGAGWLVPPGDALALADAITQARRAPRELAERGARGRSWFLQHHTKKVVLAKYEALISEESKRRRRSTLAPGDCSPR